MVRDDNGTWIRPRGQAWGNDAQRAVLHAIAEDVATRSGHRVAAIQALRSDGNLEFVAIAGNPEAAAHLLGRGTPFSPDRFLGFGVPMSGWHLIPGERLDDDARAWMSEYGHTPDLPESQHPDAWRADDRLLRLLDNEDGELRAILYLDEPRTGRRPTAESLVEVNTEIGVMFEAVVSIVEREQFGEQVRMLTQARTAMQSVRPGLGVDDFLQEMSDAMVDAMAVDSVDVLLAGGQVPELDPHTAFLEDQMREVWLRRGHLVVGPTQTWGIGDDAVATPSVLRRLMDRRGLGSWLLVPIGMGEDYLGTMGLGRRRGGPRWVDSEINAAAVVASDVAGVVLDARLMERERRLNAELRAVNDYRRDMVMTLAHELRNPVSVLWTHLELLGQEGVSGARAESWEAMDRAARRIEDMIEDLIALATVSDPGRAAPHAPVDLSALVRETCEFLAPMAALAGQEFHVDVVDGLVVTGEEGALQRLVTNLVSNAFKYTPADGQVTLALVPETVEDRDGVRLSSVDTGIGIDPSELDRVFTPFFRSSRPEARERPGTGLGLAIIERVVQSHHGAVDVESELGVGTTFRVWLPTSGPADVR